MEPLTSDLHPLTDATITVRVIKSFPHRTVKNAIFHGLDLTSLTPNKLIELCMKEIEKWKAYRNVQVDTLKIYTHAHYTKTANLIINLDRDDEWILRDEKPLAEYGIKNETELSLFSAADYEAWKRNPVDQWS